MIKKMFAWSRRFSVLVILGDQWPLWYRALTPKRSAALAVKTLTASRASDEAMVAACTAYAKT